jgi:enoyl-CoA hydratase
MKTFENLIVEKQNSIGIIRLNRPKALNALCHALTTELSTVIADFEADKTVRVIILTGSDKAFAAGADIKELQALTFAGFFQDDFVAKTWEPVARCRKPVIAAVAGYCLGGGCELAMMCDFILAADTAKFGQPEVSIGTIPGGGGTQRLTRLIGKSKAMEMCLTGRMIDAVEAERIGLVARIFPADSLMAETLKIAEKIAGFSAVAVMMAKESVNHALETTLAEGVVFERRLFQASFSTEDQKEGMAAFVEKRPADFKDK